MIKCFLCEKDITNTWKIYSIHLLREEANSPMCQECANKDFEIAHKRYAQQEEIKTLKRQLAEHRCPELPQSWLSKLFGKLKDGKR